MAQFFVWADQEYNLNTTIYAGATFRECIQNFCDDTHIRFCLLGLRHTDPTAGAVV